jgi:hypothetical protein
MKTIYVDTSVFGGKFDSEFELWTNLFFEKVFDSDLKLIYSDVAREEMTNAPQKVKDFVQSIPDKNILRTDITEEAILLAEKYLEEKVVGKSSRADCYHIAIATVLKADILISWNFKHIVNMTRIRGYNSVNLKFGYPQIDIRSPRELIDYEDN